jgi:hypothetical protein
MRKSYQEGRLAPDKIAAFEELGIIWGDSFDRLVEDSYHMMVAYHREHGGLPPSNTRLREERILLGRMLILRRAYRAGKLRDEQIERLQETGLSFEPEDERWQKRYGELVEYVSNGRDPNRIPNEEPLRGWVRNMKASYEKRVLSKDKIELLEKLGVKWDNVGYLNEVWEDNFHTVAEYFKENEVNILPSSHATYDWWKSQLNTFHKLPEERARKVRSLKPERPRHKWSEYEKTVVRENPDKSAEELAEILIGRTPEAITILRDRYGW